MKKSSSSATFVKLVGKALLRARKNAIKAARTAKTPLYVWKNGRVVALKV